MRFTIRDLITALSPVGDTPDVNCNQSCATCSVCTGTAQHALVTITTITTVTTVLTCAGCTGTVVHRPQDLRLQDLSQLRQQLRELLDEVEAEEKRAEAELSSQAVDELGGLEKKLEEALAEVRSRKAGLERE